MQFTDRVQAGQLLAMALEKYRGEPGVVYALPRGGVVLGAEIARHLRMPLDLIIARKVGHPHNPEYAIGAVTETGELVANEGEVARADPDWLARAVEREREEARRRRLRYLGGRASPDVQGKLAILVDDGIATGLTMEAAIRDVRTRKPGRIVVAIPVSPADTARRLGEEVDDVVAVDIPQFYEGAIGLYYNDFSQVSDEEVIALMANAKPDTGGSTL